MIKDRMTLALQVDTPQIRTTVDAQAESEEQVNAYSVGFIPWELVQESTLFNWTYYHGEYASGVGGYSRVTPQENPYTDDTQLSATKGIPFSYVADSAAVYVMRGLQKDPETGNFSSAGNAYHSGTDFTTASTKHIVYSTDLSNIVTSVLAADPYFDVCFCAMAVQYDDDTYSYSNCQGHFSADTRYNPITDSIPDVVFSFTINGETFTYTLTDSAFKTFTRLGLQTTVTTANHTYAIFVYCIGIWCNARISNYYYTGFIADNLPFRYSGGIGVHRFDASEQSGLGSFGFYSSNESSAYETAQGIQQTVRGVDKMTFCNADTMPTINILLTNENGAEVTENYMMYSHYYHFSMVCKSFNATDLKIMALISAPIIRVDNIYYCPEYDENYALTGNWIPYTNQTLNPDDNDFDPADIPEPEPGDDTADSGGDNILPYDFVNTPLSAANNFTTLYALTTDQVSKFGAIMWASLSDENFWHAVGVTFTNDFSINPADMMRYFVFLRYYPFDLSGVSSSYSYGIYIGRSTYPIQFPTGTAFPRRVLRNLYQLDGGEVTATLPAPYNTDDFYTMDPCTQVQAHVPYCGRVQLPASEVYGKKLKLQYVIDLQTGAIQAILSVVSNSQYIIATLAGTCGASVQITANNNIEFLTRIATVATGGIAQAGTMATQGAKIAGEEGAAAGAVLGALTGTVSALAGLPPVTVHSQGNTTGFANFGGDKQAYITIVTVKRAIPKSFAKSCGYVSNKQAKIGDLSGYTEMINPDLSGVSAHEDELNEIYNILQSGFYA